LPLLPPRSAQTGITADSGGFAYGFAFGQILWFQ